jgi:hypothetical protein
MLSNCTECGKERIDGKSWEEKSGVSTITHTSTICPDPTCQKLVDKQASERKEKSAQLIKRKMENKNLREKQASVN